MVYTGQFLTQKLFGKINPKKYIISLGLLQSHIQVLIHSMKKKMIKIFKTKITKNTIIYGQPGQILIFKKKIYVKCLDFSLEVLDAEDNKGKKMINFLLKKNNERLT